MPVAVEVAAGDLDGVRVARDTGARRVELCSGLEPGGLTPSIALVLRDAELLLAAGVDGVVVGPVLPGGRVDVVALQRLRAVGAHPVA